MLVKEDFPRESRKGNIYIFSGERRTDAAALKRNGQSSFTQLKKWRAFSRRLYEKIPRRTLGAHDAKAE